MQVAVENIFFSTNVQSALKLGQARGAAIVAAVHAGLPVAEYTALQVKQAVVGQGRAEKGQVQKMLKALLGSAGDRPGRCLRCPGGGGLPYQLP